MSLFVTSPRNNENDPGYFRIGSVVLSIPPEEIATNKIVNNQELRPLRSRFSFQQKTGHARWDVSISWKVLVDYGTYGGVPDYSEFGKLRQILAMFCAAPFVEVYNEHILQILGADDPEFISGDRMAFGLSRLRIDTLSDVTSGLQATLTMSLLNYKAYTPDFSYAGEQPGQRVNADQCKKFQAYLDSWIENNLNQPPFLAGYPSIPSWDMQEPGTTIFQYREYQVLSKTGVPAPPSAASTSSAPPDPHTVEPSAIPNSGSSNGRRLMSAAAAPPAIKDIIVAAAQRAGIDPNLALAVAQRESSFRPDAQNPSSSATGLFQLTSGTQSQLGVTNPIDPAQNANAGCLYIRRFLDQNHGDVNTALTCFAAGPGTVQQLGVEGAWQKFPWIPGWLDDIGNILEQLQAANPMPTVTTTQAGQSAFRAAQTTGQKTAGSPLSQEQITNLAQQGWIVDYDTDRSIFTYRPHWLTSEDLEHSGIANAGGSRLYISQISILFTNNLATMPLEAYQYPTMQHLGAASSAISIAFLSDGDMSQGEPLHPGLSELCGMTTLLENQFHAMKLEWRKVSTIHRMQAVLVQNQLLNMLGIYSVIPQAVSTTTVPDSPNLVQASLTCSQYENVYEQLSPFQVKGLGNYNDVWESELIGQSDHFKAALADNPNLQPLQDLVTHMTNGDLYPLYEYLSTDLRAPLVATTVPLTYQEQHDLFYNSKSALAKYNQPLYNRVSKDTSLNFNNLIALSQVQDSQVDKTWLAGYIRKVNAAAPLTSTDNPINQMYRNYLVSLFNNNAAISSAIQQFEQSTKFQQLLNAKVNGSGPGTDPSNLDHVAYRDLGLLDLETTPASYFYDYSADWRKEMQSQYGTMMPQLVETTTYFNKKLTDRDTGANVISSEKRLNPNQSISEQQQLMTAAFDEMVILGGTMDRAYPTYKLFLIEDDNLHTYYMFDDFYSYASVLNLEIIRYQDKPDTAVIQITNLANLLLHKLFDQSVEGKFEFKNSIDYTSPTVRGADGAFQGPQGVQLEDQVYRTRGGITSLTSGFDNSGKRVPLQYFALQTGSKIQVRMGYANNPDELTPVFSGIVTQIEDGEVMTVTAQSFAVELTDFDPDLTGQTLGGYLFTNGGGEATSVMERVLDTPRARHFGHWQVGTLHVEDSLKGYNYVPLAKVAGFLGAKTFSTLLLQSYDRSAENLLIEHSFLPNGNFLERGSNEAFAAEAFYFGTPKYSIPKDPSITPWRIIQDVKRRYPEFIATVKQYGFPFQCEATLVYGAPNSFYLSRLPLSSTSELAIKESDAPYFRAWWTSSGRQQFMNLDGVATSFLSGVADQITQQGPAKFNSVMQQLADVLQAGETITGVLNFGSTFDLSGGVLHNIHATQRNAQLELSRLQMEAQSAIQRLANPTQGTRPSDRFKPIRKWILVTSSSIIKNGIILNSNFYNSVRVDNDIFSVNSGVANYTWTRRVLDCDGRIIDPKSNLKMLSGLHKRYAQSFMRDELGRMYRGELVLLGTPEIEPHDVLMLCDRSTGMIGPVEVESVIHSFDQEVGYISIVKPRALVALNEAMTTGILDGCYQFVRSLFVGGEISGALDLVKNNLIAATAGTTAVAGQTLLTTAGTKALFGRVVASQAGQKVAQSVAANLVRGAATTAAETGAEVAVSIGITSATPAIAIAAALAGVAALCVLSSKQQDLTPLLLLPLSRFGKPWVAGVEGWQQNDLVSSFAQKWDVFETYEIKPYLQLLKDSLGMQQSDSPVPWLDRTLAILGK